MDVALTKADTEFLSKLVAGDICLMTPHDVLGDIVCWWSSSEYAHVVMYVGDGMFVESHWSGVRKVGWIAGDFNTRNTLVLRRANITDDDRKAVVRRAEMHVGREYDWLMLFSTAFLMGLEKCGVFVRKQRNHLDINGYDICTETVVDAYYESGITVIDSQKVNRSQVAPDDFVKFGIDLYEVARYVCE